MLVCGNVILLPLQISFPKETNKPFYPCIYSMFVSMYESICIHTCVNDSQYLKWIDVCRRQKQTEHRTNFRCSVPTLKLICWASSLALWSSALGLLLEVRGRRAVRMEQPQASQQKSWDLPEKRGLDGEAYLPTEHLAFHIIFRKTILWTRPVNPHPKLRVVQACDSSWKILPLPHYLKTQKGFRQHKKGPFSTFTLIDSNTSFYL